MMRGLKRLLALLLVVSALVWLVGLWWAKHTIPLPSPEVEVTVRSGSTRAVAAQLNRGGVNVNPILFALLARATNRDTRIKAGHYLFKQGSSPLDILNKLSRGDVIHSQVLFVEGWTFRQVREALRNNPGVTPSSLDDEIIGRAIGIAERHPEGLFFPSTYYFPKGADEVEILKTAYRKQKKTLSDLWDKRAAGLPYATPYEALIMASIVEKETGLSSDRARIAGVFVNRLKRGMLLQTDPSVIYGLGKRYDGNLRKIDLQTDGPYNTYTRVGLPPTPLAMPGLESLKAALNPERHEYLYFVARGDGTSEFSMNLNDHVKAVNKYQRGGA